MRRKFLLMTFLLAIIGFCGTSLSAQVGLQIKTEQGLREFAVSVNGGNSYYGEVVTLANDITLTGEWTPIGTGSRSSKSYSGNAFKGTFDGGDHTISGLTITSTTDDDAAIGLFGIVDGGKVKNLNLTDVNINVASSNLAGAAIGMMLNGATADNITVSGAIIGNDGVGGIVGRLIIDGTISNCINNASVTSAYGGIGGIVGKPYYEDGANTSTFASITNCINNGTVTAPMYVGGIAGLVRANVTGCTNNGAVVGGTQTGGIVGQLMAAGTVSGNENKAKVSGKNHLGGIIGDYSQSSAYTYNNVSIANNINRGELAATEQCAAIMGCNNIDGFTAMTATGNVSYYYVEGLELFGNPEDMVIDETNKFIIPVAQVGEQTFYTFAEAADAAQAGSEIKLLANIEGDITVPANVTLNGNGFAISGGILAEGDITFAGVTTAADFDANVANTAVNIPAGASLQLTGSARLVIGHGATFNITGTIEDAKTADKATLVPSLKIAAGASITGNGVTFNVNNAYIVANANTTSKNSNANGTLDFNIDNSIWEQTGVLAFYVPTSGMDPVVNFELKKSVLTTTSHLVFSVTKGEIVIDNSLVNQGTSRQIENRSTMTIKNGSVVNGAVATSSNAKNPGTLIVEDATYAVTGEFSGSDLGTGTLIMKNGASFRAGKITKANIQIDATGMAIGDEINLTADLSNHAGTLEVINNDNLDAEIIDGKIVLVEKPVAKIGDVKYGTLNEALNAAAQTEELTTIQLLAGTHTFGNVKFPATLKNVTIVGADNKATIIKDSKLYSADGNAVTYKGITFDGIVFDNSSILFTGARNGEVVYEDWTIKKCDFRNLQSTDGIAAIHFNLAADETIKNFTFEKNTITNVTSPSNSASGLRLNYVTGDVVIKDNETNNVAFNAVQIINSEVDNFTFEGNILRSNSNSLANLYNVTGENIVITKNQFLANENQISVSNIEYADVSGNYWGGGAPKYLPEGVVYSSYYTTVESDGTLGGLVELPQGNDFTGYTGVDAIWGETWGNASESFVIKVLDANGNVMGTTSLNNIGGIIDGDVNVTWNIKLDAASNTDEYWTMAWTTAPTINNMPAKVELWVDGVKVSGGNVVLNGPDEINKIYAAVTDNDGKIYSYHTSIANAVDAITGTRSVTPNVIALLRNTDETVTLPAGITLNLNGFTAANVSVPVAQIGETPYYTLSEAVAAAETGATITLFNGEHELPLFAGKELTFKGESKEGVIVNDAPAATTQGWNGSTFHFENLTAKGATANYHGLANGVKAVTYNNCKINGLRFLYATNGVSFEDCTFNAEGVEHSFWTYGASNVTVTDCTFTYTDRAVNCYSENGANHELDITFEGCSFTYAGTNDTPEGAVEINSGSVKSIDLVMNDCTAPAEGAMWFNSQWDSKNGENTVVVVDDIIVWQVLPVAMIGDVQYKSLQAALDAAAAGTGNVTVEILRNIDLTGIDWNPVTVSGPGYPVVTVNGNNKTITGLNDMLFAGTWAGNPGLIIKDLTIANSTIVNDKDDTKGTVGVGAFIGFPQASETITLNNCHLVNSTVEGGHWTGGLIGYAAGYAGTDGPVFMNLTITGCSVTGSTITGNGSAGGIIGHGSGNAWTNVVIENTTVSNNTITSTGTSTNKAGAIMGTIGAAGQPTTVNGVTHTGGATVSATVSGNTVKSNNVEITTIYGRQGTETGMLELNGGSYDNYPIEEGVAYAAPAEGYKIEENENGTYGVVFSAVAQIGTKYYSDLHEAMVAAKAGETVKLVNDVDLAGTEWEPVSFKGIFDGQDHTISNLTINKPGVSSTGFITSLNGSFGNVIFENPTVTGGENTAVVAGRAGGGAAYAHNITINGTIKVETTHSGYARTGGIVGGWAYGKYENITIDGGDKATSYIKHTGGGDGRYVAGIVGHADGVDSYTNCTVKNITISGGWLCGGIAGPGPADGLATGCSVENIDMGADYSGGMFGWYYGDGTIKDATVKNVTFTDGSAKNGAIGGYSNNEDATVKNVNIDNVKNENGAPIFTFAATIADGTDTYYYATLEAAFTAATEGQTITLLGNCELSESIKVNNNITLDLNGDTITGTDNATGSFALIEIQPGAELIIEDSSEPSTGNITLTATNNREWNAYSSVISNQRGKLTVNGGTIEHLGGTDMAYGIDNLTNGKGTYAETVINGGYIKSPYRGIRQFLNGIEAQNILTVNGGTIEGDNKSIWMQDPSVNANTGTLEVRKEANLIGDVYLYVTPNSTSWPVEVSIAAEALAEGSEVLTGNVPAGYELKLVDGVYGVCSVEAKIGEVTYATLAAAVNAANEGDTITLVTDITFTEATRTHNSGSWYDGLYYSGDKSFTIDLDSYTIGHDNSVNDYLLNFKNDGAKANVINLINGTIEAGSTAYCALATSSSNTNKITINTENINIINNNSNGSTIKVRGGVELNVNAGTVITGKDSYLGIECVASTVNIYDGAEIYMNGNTSYKGCLVGACANGTVNVYGGYGEGVKGGFIAMTSGGTINVAGGEWIANTDGTVGDNSNLYVLTAQNNKNESGYAGASIINVTGGTFRGGMDAWILNNDANVEKAELNISGGNFNADPTSYVVSDNYKVVNEDDGTYTVEVDGFEKFYTAAGVETTSDNAAYSLSFTVTDYANNKVSVKIGNKKPAQNSAIHLVTPKTVEFDNVEFNVTSVANSGFYGTSFKKVTISEGVETIGNKALHFMSKLTELVLPSTLVSVGEQCIGAYNPSSVPLKSIVCYAEEAPSAFEPTSNASFQTCVEQQTMLIVPNAADYTVYSNANGWKFTNILGIGSTKEIAGKDDKYTLLATVTSIEPNECSIKIGNTKPAANSNAELVLPEVVDFFPSVEGLDFTVTSIPDQAFSSCLYFVGDLVIPQNVRTIGAGAFNTSHFVANETVRGTLTLNAGLVSIGSQAFKKDYFKGDLYIPSTVETIASNAFQYASFDGILTINGNIDCANAFGGTGFTELVLVEGVEEIKDSNAFSGMTELKEVVLPLTLQTIGMAAFKDDNAIEVIHTYATEVPAINSIPDNVNYKYAFSETVKANAVLYVHGTSYDDVLKYKNATNEWKEFQNIHLYGAVAQIEEVEYLTIQDAINAAQAGETITVIDNVELTETITVAADKEVVFDLNGKVVSYTTTEYVGEAMITNNGNLTINDSAEGGKLSYAYEGGANSSYGFGNSTIENKGVLTINAGTVENTSAAMSHASYAINTGAGATLNVEGGNILNLNGHAVRMVSFGTELNTVNINGGYIEGTRALQVQLPGSASSTTKPAMDLNITGGELMSNEETYNLAIYVFSNGQSAENVSVEISGGTFNGNVAVNAAATNSMPANAVAITGGTFNGDYGVFSYSDEDAAQAVISITGGTFATNYSEWYAEDEQYVFELNENGTYSVVEQTIFTQTTQLNAGWNWFSYYVNTDLETLENELGESAAQIKSHTQGFDIYAGPETWSGTLNEILPEQMYMINANEPSTLNLKGETIDHENVEIILVKNAWNWIGYPINGSVNLSDAFNGVEITIGDQIKSHNHGFAYYIGNNTWTGDLQVLVKGEGYMYHNTSNNDVVFTYNVPQGKSNSELKSNITTNGNYWIPNASQYPNNMTMTAMVDVEGGDYEVAAFVDGEVRGSARPIYVEPIDAYVLFLTIHGEGVEEMTFKFYDLTTGEEFDLNDRMNYSDDAIVGSLKEPYMFNRGTTGIGEAAMSEVNIYPNPTTTGTEINLQATCDTVEVFNALGVKVAEYHNVDSIDAFETAGIYVIRITNNGDVHNCRLAVK